MWGNREGQELWWGNGSGSGGVRVADRGQGVMLSLPRPEVHPHFSLFPDKPTAKIEPNPQYPREGEKLRLQCEGQGNPV